MIPGPIVGLVELVSGLVVASIAFTLLLYRSYRLEGEALGQIGNFMRENPGLMLKGGDGFLERFLVTNYICNSFGVTRSHYTRRVKEMKEFIVDSAKETR